MTLPFSAVKQLQDDMRALDYRVRFDFRKALDKNNRSYLKARKYLHRQGIDFHTATVEKAEKQEDEKVEKLQRKRALRLAPTLGAPTMKSPLDVLRMGVHIVEETSVKRLICGSLSTRALKLDSRLLTTLPTFLATNFALQLGCFKTMTATRNTMSDLLSYSKLPGLSLRNFTTLLEVRLSGNRLSSLPWDIGALTSLRTLLLDDNLLNSLPPTFSKLNRLLHLSMNKNNFDSLPYDLGELKELRHLSINTNLISELPPTFHKLASLTYLDMSDNKLIHLGILPTVETQLWYKSSPLDWKEIKDSTTGQVNP